MTTLSRSIDQTLSEVTHRIVQTARPQRIILFGSAARGTAAPDSDLDFLVIVREPVHRRQLAQKIYRNLHGVGTPVDIVVATQADLDAQAGKPGSIFRSALVEGQVIYDAKG